MALLSRDTGVPASERLRIEDEVFAMDVDLAVSLRLLRHDNECRKAQAKLIAYEVGKMLNGGKDD